MAIGSPNFAFLADHDPVLVRLATHAERYAADDPNTAIFKVRQFAEYLAQLTAAHVGLRAGPDYGQLDLIRDLERRAILDREVSDLFHRIRTAGNTAAHAMTGQPGEAIHLIKLARALAVWFHRSFGCPDFKAGAYEPVARPGQEAKALKTQLGAAEASLADAKARLAGLQSSASASEEALRVAEKQAEYAAVERDTALALAEETEELLAAERERFEQHLASALVDAESEPKEVAAAVERAHEAATELVLDEAETRKLIDDQLRQAGWDADSEELRWEKGVRPQKGRDLAIAEVPTATGPADYVLFRGLTPLGIVEAKRKNKNVAGALDQSKRYSKGFTLTDGGVSPGGPWGDFQVPFLFSSNGRPYFRQVAELSGIWFQDVRRPTNHSRALQKWKSPDGLADLLTRDVDAAQKKLEHEPTDILQLRDYQQEAIRSVEAAFAAGNRQALVAMATGTGKTRTCFGLVYRLLKAGRFRRVLFLVDRRALGEQTLDKLEDARPEGQQPFTAIYDVKGLADKMPEPETRLHVTTVQGIVRRILDPTGDEPPVPVDTYDCIVIDECHRGYNLDREMSDAELGFRSEADYVSKYRQALDHFDAVKVGLTATPALHTVEIFGKPVYEYSYRRAVIDGWLTDHEPPIRLVTKLAEEGITWAKGEEVPVYDTGKGQLQLFEAPDQIDLEVDDFNEKVITENFNRVICRELARRIDPTLPGKTLIFCVRDLHADLVVRLLKEAFEAQYGEVDDDAVKKITGAADRPLELIRHYKNERLPSVAVTVDLLTTGIDVPAIDKLVFIRRVRSRILYEQMLGRATRLCPDLHGQGEDKESFTIYDAVDMYEVIGDWSTMKPVITKVSHSFEQLVRELTDVDDEDARREILDQLRAKLHRKRRQLEERLAEEVEAATGKDPRELLRDVRGMGPDEATVFFAAHPSLVSLLDRRLLSPGQQLLVSHHEDELVAVQTGYGDYEKPEDFLESFGRFVKVHQDDLAALKVVITAPRDLTRQQLKELRLALDEAGYGERVVRAAWKATTNQDIAASIIGFIRQQALGSPLVPYQQRVERAVTEIRGSRDWTPPQQKWLERIGKQLAKEGVVDRAALDHDQFRAYGGFNRLNKTFDGELERILGDLQDRIWQDVG